MNKKFKILMADDQDYEDLIAEIYYENEFVAMITQEEGFEHLRILIYPPKLKANWDFSFNEFEEVISIAKKGLKEMRKISEDS
jgi:hypothetical protein